MKIAGFILLCTLIFSSHVFASPLIFKGVKDVKDFNQTEIANLDTSKFRELRITIKSTGRSEVPVRSDIQRQLDIIRPELQRGKDLLAQGVISQARVEELQKNVDKLENQLKNTAPASYFPIEISSIEAGDEAPLITIRAESSYDIGTSFNIFTPPSRISVKVWGKGTYKIFIWAQ